MPQSVLAPECPIAGVRKSDLPDSQLRSENAMADSGWVPCRKMNSCCLRAPLRCPDALCREVVPVENTYGSIGYGTRKREAPPVIRGHARNLLILNDY